MQSAWFSKFLGSIGREAAYLETGQAKYLK